MAIEIVEATNTPNEGRVIWNDDLIELEGRINEVEIGIDAFSTTSASFVQPAVDATVSVTVDETGWMAVGQPVYMTTGGSYTVSSVTDTTHVVLTNLGYTGNAAVAATVASGKKVSPGGFGGPSGATTPDATETVKGKAEIATQGETDAGTDDTRFVTPLKLANYSGLGGGGGGPTTVTEDFEDASLNFTITGDWARDNDFAHAGTWSFSSGTTADGDVNEAQVAVTIPPGAGDAEVSFWYRVDSESGFDLFKFVVDMSGELADSGFQDWTFFSIPIEVGSHTLLFQFDKDSSGSSGDDKAWIDDLTLSYTPGSTAGIDVVTADPASPVEGQQWIRADLSPPQLRLYTGAVAYKLTFTTV